MAAVVYRGPVVVALAGPVLPLMRASAGLAELKNRLGVLENPQAAAAVVALTT